MEAVVNNAIGSFYKDKKILVTGHTGFKGSWLITWLHQLGARVKGFALPPQNDIEFYNAIAASTGVESVTGDIRNQAHLAEAVLSFGPDLIFHMAAQPLVRYGYGHPLETFEVNAMGTAHLLEAVRLLEKKCTVVLITTDKVYHNTEQDYAYVEDDKLGGYDPYSASKAAAEIIIDCYRNSFFNINTYPVHHKTIVVGRAGNVIGGGDRSTDRLMPDIIHSLQDGQPVLVRNPGAVRPWQHVLEPLGGYLLLGMLADTDPAKYSGAYNFGPDPEDHITVQELVAFAISSWGSGSWKDMSDAAQPHEAGLLKLDTTKARKILNWRPRLNCRQAVEWSVEWYRQAPGEGFSYAVEQIKRYQQMDQI